MDLGAHQRGILALLKSAEPVQSDDYLRQIAGSDELRLAREVVLWWHAFRIERYCPLTSALLKQLNSFEPSVKRVFHAAVLSHFIEETGAAFLEVMSTHQDGLVAAVAQFEYALLRVKLGDAEEYRIVWDSDPRSVLEALVNDTVLDLPAWRGSYVTVVRRDLPQMIQVLRMQIEPGLAK
jgi:hypothetical protein